MTMVTHIRRKMREKRGGGEKISVKSMCVKALYNLYNCGIKKNEATTNYAAVGLFYIFKHKLYRKRRLCCRNHSQPHLLGKTETDRRHKNSSSTEVLLSCSLNEAQSQSRNLAVL